MHSSPSQIDIRERSQAQRPTPAGTRRPRWDPRLIGGLAPRSSVIRAAYITSPMRCSSTSFLLEAALQQRAGERLSVAASSAYCCRCSTTSSFRSLVYVFFLAMAAAASGRGLRVWSFLLGGTTYPPFWQRWWRVFCVGALLVTRRARVPAAGVWRRRR